MVKEGTTICPICGLKLRYFDTVHRIKKSKRGEVKWILIQRLQCSNKDHRHIHREIPDYILPNKHYETDIIDGVIAGYITSDTMGYENYPCEMTMSRWRSQKIHRL